MTHSYSNDERDKKALLVGSALILLVGAYFIGKSFFFNKKDFSQISVPAIVDKKEGVPLIEPSVLLKKIQNGDSIVLVDVRDEASFQAEHLSHSLSIPIGSLENFSPNKKDEAVVIVFSESDPETFEAAKNIMSQKSFAYFFLKGGFEGWKTANSPTVSAGDPNSFIDQSKITYIKTEEYKKLVEQNNQSFFVLDVQAKDNFKKKHIKGASNIPLSELEKRADEIPSGKQIIVYGENDLVSFQGGVHLSDLGIFAARTLNSGGKDYFSAESPLPLEP
jgi:rhodanese-related sulfurtransferase